MAFTPNLHLSSSFLIWNGKFYFGRLSRDAFRLRRGKAGKHPWTQTPKSCWKGKMNPEFKTDFRIKSKTIPVPGGMLQRNGPAPHHDPGPSFCSIVILKGLLPVVALQWETNSGDTVPECWFGAGSQHYLSSLSVRGSGQRLAAWLSDRRTIRDSPRHRALTPEMPAWKRLPFII